MHLSGAHHHRSIFLCKQNSHNVPIPTMSTSSSPIPILLLKTRSTPNDGYYDEFSSPSLQNDGVSFKPIFIPVLEHKILDDGMNLFSSLLKNRKIGNREGCKYGGLIFTSQRAVEAFALLVSEGKEQDKGTSHFAFLSALCNELGNS
jgi:hypothetical protein